MFYATSLPDYNTGAQEWADDRYTTVDYPANYSAYYNANYFYVNLPAWTGQQWSIAQLQANSTNYAVGLRSDRVGYYLSPLSILAGLNAYQQPYTVAKAVSRINEPNINATFQRLETAWKGVEAHYPNNVKYIPAWTTISVDDASFPQPISKFASSPRSFFSDCIHLNNTGYSSWVDNILNQWLPQAKYLNTRN